MGPYTQSFWSDNPKVCELGPEWVCWLDSSLPGNARREFRWAFHDPADELFESWMGFKGIYIGEVAGQFGFRKRRVDFLVANMVQSHGRAAFTALQFGHQMMQRRGSTRRDRAIAERADRGILFCHFKAFSHRWREGSGSSDGRLKG